MVRSPNPFLLTELSWKEVERHLQRDRRLLVPIGVCDQYGPHLPIGASTIVAEAVTGELSREFGILLAPTFPVGVNLAADRPFPGTAGAQEKTLHRLLNDVLAAWEDSGFEEFILVTAHDYDPHIEALASVSGTRARVRVIEVLGIDFSEFLDGRVEPQHGGEVLTSLMLYLRPDKVNLAQAQDFDPPNPHGEPWRIDHLPPSSSGSVGYPSRATAEKGRLIFEHILSRIRTKVLLGETISESGR
ncbi:MAG TPA: creatininase family protein [Longimicrobiaceae bacterium]